jgi:hypothetical protein
MVIVKYVVGACVLMLAAAGASGMLSESKSNPGDSLDQPISGYPPAVDMSRFQKAFG